MTTTGYAKIDRVTVGDDWELFIEFKDVPAGQSLQQLRFTARETFDASPVISKTITTSVDPGNGRITDDGFTTGVAKGLLEFPGNQTLLLTPGVSYICDVEARSSAGKTQTIRRSLLVGEGQVSS